MTSTGTLFESSSGSARIDRIGSLDQEIQLVNFWPTPDLNKYINLKNRVEARMALVDISPRPTRTISFNTQRH